MKKTLFLTLFMNIVLAFSMFSQSYSKVNKSGKCGSDVEWTLTGSTLEIRNISLKGNSRIDEYDLDKKSAPWIKQKLKITKVIIGNGIDRIGSCAFANCKDLETVEFDGITLSEIGWGAFYNCKKLYQISIPVLIKKIETIAFANCSSIRTLKIPSQAVVEDKAFASCTSLSSIEIGPDVALGNKVFATEYKENGKTEIKLYDKDIIKLPTSITESNCSEFGLSPDAVKIAMKRKATDDETFKRKSDVDQLIPEGSQARNNTYALVIGNQYYRFVPEVPFAINDALTFVEYCKITLGIPSENIHYSENATKHMILEVELEDWLRKEIPNKQKKNLIIYYAGHGVPDIKDGNKAYILPTDVRGTTPYHGIALDDFYSKIGDMGFNLVTIFLDACFSGINRNNKGLGDERAVEVEAQESTPMTGNLIVFSAAQGNETAQGFQDQGHGLFTYYLLKELKETKGDISFGKLADSLNKQVSNKAPYLNLKKKQSPTTYSSPGFSSWKSSTF